MGAVLRPRRLRLRVGLPRDLLRYTQGRFYLYLAEADFFRAADPITQLAYAGAAGTTTEAQALTAPSPVLGVRLTDGGFLRPEARYDAAADAWVWAPTGGTPFRLRDGRLAVNDGYAVRFSSDEGRTWGAGRTVWAEAPFFTFRLRTPGAVVQTEDGALYATSSWETSTPTPERTLRTALAVSRDGGATWAAASLQIGGPEEDPTVLAAGAGDVLYGYGRRSRDGGATWEASPAAVPLGALATGEVVFTDGNERDVLRLLGRDGTTVRTLGRMNVPGATSGGLGLLGAGSLLHVDADGYAYAGCGQPLVQVCRSTAPLR